MATPYDDTFKIFISENAQDFLSWLVKGAILKEKLLTEFEGRDLHADCERHHSELVVINGENLSPEQELVGDLIAIVTVFSARLQSLRSYRKVLKDAALQKE